jgi:DNA-binding GntR family transcriptional regulator
MPEVYSYSSQVARGCLSHTFLDKSVTTIFNTVPLSAQVENALKEEILSGRLLPGQRIDLQSLAKLWNVSPTPLRDAVRSLANQGLVAVSPRRGVFVAAVDKKALKEIFELRIALECTATELATSIVPAQEAEHALSAYKRARDATNERERRKALAAIDNLIHDVIIRHCGNSRLIKIMNGLRDHVRWSQQNIIARVSQPYNTTLPEHIRIAEAVCRRDTAAAVAAMREHLENSYQRFLSRLETNSETTVVKED